MEITITSNGDVLATQQAARQEDNRVYTSPVLHLGAVKSLYKYDATIIVTGNTHSVEYHAVLIDAAADPYNNDIIRDFDLTFELPSYDWDSNVEEDEVEETIEDNITGDEDHDEE